jgi:hypothetical protein
MDAVADRFSASIDPNDLTASARWLPVAAGAAGDEERSGFGESTVPKARLPLMVSAKWDETIDG